MINISFIKSKISQLKSYTNYDISFKNSNSDIKKSYFSSPIIYLNGTFNTNFTFNCGSTIFLENSFNLLTGSFTLLNNSYSTYNYSLIGNSLSSSNPLTIFFDDNISLNTFITSSNLKINLIPFTNCYSYFSLYSNSNIYTNVITPTTGVFKLSGFISNLNFEKSKGLTFTVIPNSQIENFTNITKTTFKAVNCDLNLACDLINTFDFHIPIKSLVLDYAPNGFLRIPKSLGTIKSLNIFLIINNKKIKLNFVSINNYLT